MTDKYAVIGNPIEHSKSPLIHAAFAKQTQQVLSYEAIMAPIDGFSNTVNRLIKKGYKGVNVTMPFKVEAFHLGQHRGHALNAGAVNTLSFGEQVVGDNTDGVGLVRDIEKNLNVSIKNKRVLLIGAGGAAQGVVNPIAEQSPALLVIANRSSEKALAIVQRLQTCDEYKGTKFKSKSFGAMGEDAYDIVINATSAGLNNTVLLISNTVFANSCLAYDMMYGHETPFMAQARVAGATVADGLGMLVEQAAEAFYIWRNVRPETKAVINSLRKS